MPADREMFLALVESTLPEMQAEAARLDVAPAFPHGSFARLTQIGLLKATVPEILGGLGFGDGAGGALSLLRLLACLGEGNLAVARLFEAHVNALHLIVRYGTAELASACARDAAAGHVFALWVTDPAESGLRLLPADAGFILDGCKAFCSGAGVATRALVTATTATGVQMLVVAMPPGAGVLDHGVRLAGMRAAITGSVDFSGMDVEAPALLGDEGDYLREPVFSAGAWRSAAAALGGLRALLERHRHDIRQRGRDADPHQQARFGHVVMAYETARLWMEQAALRGCLEDAPASAIVAYVNLARLAVEAACLDAMRHTQRSLGLSAFMAGHAVERLCRDLSTYLRQPAPDETLVKAAIHYFAEDLPR